MTQQKQLEAILEEALLVWKQDYPKSDGDNGLLMDEYFERLEKAKLKATQTIKSLVTAEIIAELERLETGYLQCLNCEGSHLIKSVTEEHIKDRIKYYKAKETQL